MSDDFVTLSEWEDYCHQERRKYWEKKDRENARIQEKFNKELQQLLHPPPPPPRPEPPPAPPDEDDPAYADYVFQMNEGLLKSEIESEDDDD
jgi:hypothetical protein